MASSRQVKSQGISLIRVLGHVAFSLTPLMSRPALSDTEQLHRKIFEMGQRIRQLEDALAILQSDVSTETHPLLANQALPIIKPKSGPGPDAVKDELAETLNGFGTLAIGDSGEVKYFGAIAGSEVRALHQPVTSAE